VISTFLTQCVGAIFLYHRQQQQQQQQQDAVMLFNQRVFELSCSSLVVGILTIGLLFNIPTFKDHILNKKTLNN